MPAPVLSPSEIARLQAEKAKQENFRDSMLSAVPQKQARALEYAEADGAFKKFFDYYNDDIIGKYDAERKALDGKYIAVPISEADIVGPASLDGSSRTAPVPPSADVTRIPQFDGGPLIETPLNEAKHILDQAGLESSIIIGYGPSGFNEATAKTGSALSAASTQLTVTDPTNPISLGVNGQFIVYDGGDLAVVKITEVITPPGGIAPYTGIYGIELVVAPTGTIPMASSMTIFMGFNNTERTNKTASNASLQPLMNWYVAGFQAAVNGRIARINEQLAAIAANQDPDGTAQFTTATTNANTSKTFLQNYIVTTDISNTGLSALAAERAVRSPQISARVAQIEANYTGQTMNYYEERYTYANNRGNVSRGSLRLQKATEESASQLTTYADGAQASIDAIDQILS